jgi:HK97 family phage major capsid protein
MESTAKLRQRYESLKTEVRELTDKDELTPDEELRFADALDEAKVAEAELTVAESRDSRVGAILSVNTGSAPGQINRRNPFDVDVTAEGPEGRSARRDAALELVERRQANSNPLAARQADHIDHLLRTGGPNVRSDYIASRALITSSDAYQSAWMKGLVNPTTPLYTDDESRALQAYSDNERRAASEGTPSAGGYGVPVLIDPTIILTSGALDVPILSHCRIETITTDQWKGVTSNGLIFEFTAEAAGVADKTPTLAQPTIPVNRADGFIPYSYEIGQDYPGFVEEMGALLAQGYLNLIASSSMVGTGSTAMTGLFTALASSGGKCANGDSGTAVTVTTLGEFSGRDIRAAWGALPELFRGRASWVMNVTQMEQARALGSVAAGYAAADFTVDLSHPDSPTLAGREVILSDYAPAYVNTTATTQQFMVVGDLSQYMIVQRAGMVVEQIPNLFSTSTGFPTGQRGFLAWARLGGNALAGNPFRILSNGS